MFGLKSRAFDASELQDFRRWQRVAFEALEGVIGTLREGDSESIVSRRIHQALKLAGTQNYVHVPVALFGDRTAYPGAFGQVEALPTEGALRA